MTRTVFLHMSPLSTNTYACTQLHCTLTQIMHLVFTHFFPLKWFFREPDPSIVGASDIGQGSTPKSKLKNKVQVELEL